MDVRWLGKQSFGGYSYSYSALCGGFSDWSAVFCWFGVVGLVLGGSDGAQRLLNRPTYASEKRGWPMLVHVTSLIAPNALAVLRATLLRSSSTYGSLGPSLPPPRLQRLVFDMLPDILKVVSVQVVAQTSEVLASHLRKPGESLPPTVAP